MTKVLHQRLRTSVRRLTALVRGEQELLDTEYNQPGTPVWQRTGFMHRQRYTFAAGRVTGKRVLNLACGPGYAEQVLASGRPSEVVAVDYDRDLIERLRRRAPVSATTNIEYLWADAEDLPSSLGKFDVIVSFENIEHLRRPTRFLEGARRLAQPGAQLFLSTPNRLKYSGHPQQPVNNPYHVREYDFDELAALITPMLSNVTWFGQFQRTHMELSDDVQLALRNLNSLWVVRLERACRRLIDKPIPNFHFLPLETDLRPLDPASAPDADTFVLVGTIG